jgi:NADP-dependent 3-hydroxy acid dehydrogenase YdfG
MLSEQLRGHLAVVTGATSGIGRAIAEALLSRGAVVWVVGRRIEQLRELAERFPAARAHCADLTDDAAIEELRQVLEAQGSLDIVVHSAGVMKLGSCSNGPVADLDWMYRTNVRAPFVLTQGVLPLLSARGQIVFLNSSAGLGARAQVGQYSATKHALKALADSLREELHPTGRRVLNVFAGRVATPMQAELCAAEGRPFEPAHLIDPAELATLIVDALASPTAEVKEINIRPRFD